MVNINCYLGKMSQKRKTRSPVKLLQHGYVNKYLITRK